MRCIQSGLIHKELAIAVVAKLSVLTVPVGSMLLFCCQGAAGLHTLTKYSFKRFLDAQTRWHVEEDIVDHLLGMELYVHTTFAASQNTVYTSVCVRHVLTSLL